MNILNQIKKFNPIIIQFKPSVSHSFLHLYKTFDKINIDNLYEHKNIECDLEDYEDIISDLRKEYIQIDLFSFIKEEYLFSYCRYWFHYNKYQKFYTLQIKYKDHHYSVFALNIDPYYFRNKTSLLFDK